MNDNEELKNIVTGLLVLAHRDAMQSILVEFKLIFNQIIESLKINGIEYDEPDIKKCLSNAISNFLVNNLFQKAPDHVD